jgi:predicted metal-dependent HD superfamily phosphohydrolase
MKIDSTIVKAAETFVTNYLSTHLGNGFSFHDLSHTLSVVKAVETICSESGTAKHEKRILLVAAWFHDLGYTKRIDQHEDIGACLAENFLKENGVDENDIDLVKSNIIATHFPQLPLTPGEKILCDADMIHLADKNYFEKADVLRKEWAITRGKVYSDEEWLKLNINFLSDHSYHTSYCQENFNDRKQKNIKKLLAMQQLDFNNVDQPGIEINGGKKKEKKNATEYGRGVETLFRVASSNHMRLSGMADNKAHILLSINSIIISVILSVLAKKLTEATFLVLPTALLLCVCLATIVFAVLTTRPKVSKKGITMDQINNREVNLLFFGNFHQLEPETYESGMNEMMRDREYLYKTLTKDVYYLGKVLAVKYRYLNIGYTIFMCGLVISVLAYGISFFLSHPVY